MNKAEREDFNKLIDFEDFWLLYNYKTAKKAAKSAWNRLSEAKRQLIMDHLPERLATDKQWCEWGSKPHAATFINQERWEDEYERCDDNNKAGPESIMERLQRVTS